MNSLERVIKSGEIVLMDPLKHNSDLTEAQLLWKCDGGGFGSRPDTMGRQVGGHWTDGTEPHCGLRPGEMICCTVTRADGVCSNCEREQRMYVVGEEGPGLGKDDRDTGDLITGQTCKFCKAKNSLYVI